MNNGQFLFLSFMSRLTHNPNMSFWKQSAFPFLSGFIGSSLLFLFLVFVGLPILPGGKGTDIFVYGSFLEELIKFVIALIVIRFGTRPLRTAFVGVGFGIAEFFYRYIYTGSAGFLVPPMHAVAGIATAWYLYKAVQETERRYRFKYLLYAFLAGFLIHASYNEIMGNLYFYLTN